MTVYRKLLPAERRRYKDHLLRLDRADRYSRFSGTVSEETIERHCQESDWRYTILLGCFVKGELRGAVELRTDPTLWADNAELAISVEKGFQGLGMGRELMRRSLNVARNRSIRHVHMMCLRGNRRMLSLAREFGGKVAVEEGEFLTDFAQDWPNQTSLMVEAIEDGQAAVSAVLDQIQVSGERIFAHQEALLKAA